MLEIVNALVYNNLRCVEYCTHKYSITDAQGGYDPVADAEIRQ